MRAGENFVAIPRGMVAGENMVGTRFSPIASDGLNELVWLGGRDENVPEHASLSPNQKPLPEDSVMER
jgi:hypothetical protein